MDAVPSDVNVSVIVLHYRGLGMLHDCLASLAPAVGPAVEVVLVDNGSTDDLREIDRQYPWACRVSTGENLGFAGGNNRGLEHCRGRYVLLLNDDTVVGTRFVGQLAEYLDRHPQVGVVQGKMVLPRHEWRLDVCGSFITWTGFPYHYGYFKPDGPRYAQSLPVFGGKGACLMFRRDLIERVGGFLFDESFFCYYEETDFCHRVWLAGSEVHFVATEPIEHLMGGSTGGDARLMLGRYLRNMIFSLAGNLSTGSQLRILPPYYAMLTASLLLCLVTGRLEHAKACWGALIWPLQQWPQIKARRRLIRSIRRVSDREIFAKTLRNPRWDYFIKSFQGRLAAYEDEVAQ